MPNENLETPPDPNVTIDGETFTLDEQLCMATLWLASKYNAHPQFIKPDREHEAKLKATADKLVKRGFVKEVHYSLYHDGPNPPYYVLESGAADAIADKLVDKFSLRELIPQP